MKRLSEQTAGPVNVERWRLFGIAANAAATVVVSQTLLGCHVHFKLRLFAGTAKTYEFTPQFFLDETLTDTVHALSPYSSKRRRDTINTRDGIYNSLTAGEKVALTLVTSPSGSGYAGIINVGVQVG
jgi:hypothetical protein